MPDTSEINDPMERLIGDALDDADIPYIHNVPAGYGTLDFYLPLQDVYIEVKRFYSDRIDRQMSSAQNIIVCQGKEAVLFLAKAIRGTVR
jgi:hypothetical protein